MSVHLPYKSRMLSLYTADAAITVAVILGALSSPGVENIKLTYRFLAGNNWIAVKELKLSYYIGVTLLFTTYTHYGNLIQVP